jgi:superfamily II DNA or RNA helicase
MISLYDYQEQYIAEIKSLFRQGKKRVVLCSATGSGKTIMFSYMTREASQRNKKILILTDRKELFSQSHGSLFNMGLTAKEIKPNKNIDLEGNLYVAMSQTIQRRIHKEEYLNLIQSMDLIIIDEAHKMSFDYIFRYITEKTYVIGATATPHREGKQTSLEEFYDDIVQVIDTPHLIDKEKLSKCTSFGVPVDLSGIKTKNGDYDEKSMGDKFSEMKLYHGVYENYMRIAPNEKAIIFAPNIQSSIDLVKDWESKGLPIKHVDCYMNNREEVIEWFKNSTNGIISNYGILTTGFDVPDIQIVILYRATKSLPLFLQMVGRGSRVTATKKTFKLLDFGNNIKRHNYWEYPRQWSLRKKKKNEGVAPIKECPECAYMMHARIMKCPECGHEFEPSEKEKEQKEFAELVEMSGVKILELAKVATIKDLIKIQKAKNYPKKWIYYYLKTADDFRQYGKLMEYHWKWADHQINLRKLK